MKTVRLWNFMIDIQALNEFVIFMNKNTYGVILDLVFSISMLWKSINMYDCMITYQCIDIMYPNHSNIDFEKSDDCVYQ